MIQLSEENAKTSREGVTSGLRCADYFSLCHPNLVNSLVLTAELCVEIWVLVCLWECDTLPVFLQREGRKEVHHPPAFWTISSIFAEAVCQRLAVGSGANPQISQTTDRACVKVKGEIPP